MKACLIIFILFASKLLIAQQTRFTVTPNPVSISFISNDSDHTAHGVQRNLSSRELELLWIREILQMPRKWNSYVCDANFCYDTMIGKCPEFYPNKINARDSAILDVHVRDSGVTGEAHIVMWVFEREDTSQKIKVDYLFNKTVSNNEGRMIEIKVYPNPAYNSFSVDYNHSLTRIDLYTLLGKKIASFKAKQNTSYDISQLSDGLYFMKLIGNNEKIFKTIRLQKRSYRT